MVIYKKIRRTYKDNVLIDSNLTYQVGEIIQWIPGGPDFATAAIIRNITGEFDEIALCDIRTVPSCSEDVLQIMSSKEVPIYYQRYILAK